MAAHPLLRRSQSYIPTSAAKPPAGPPVLKSGYCVKQGNVVSAGGPLCRGQWGGSARRVALGCLLPHGLGMLQMQDHDGMGRVPEPSTEQFPPLFSRGRAGSAGTLFWMNFPSATTNVSR